MNWKKVKKDEDNNFPKDGSSFLWITFEKYKIPGNKNEYEERWINGRAGWNSDDNLYYFSRWDVCCAEKGVECELCTEINMTLSETQASRFFSYWLKLPSLKRDKDGQVLPDTNL